MEGNARGSQSQIDFWAVPRVSVRWLGHACFQISFVTGPGQEVSVVTDPFRKGMGYSDISTKADVVTISHGHSDHDQVGGIKGDPLILRGITDDGQWAEIRESIRGVEFEVVGTYHDQDQGDRRGRNACFVMSGGGLTLVHLGDLGHIPDDDALGKIGSPDILFIPVGGYFTIDARNALEVISIIQPRICIPMHYRTAAIKDWPIKPIDDFLAGCDRVRHVDDLVLDPDSLPGEPEVWVLKYE